MNSIEILHQYCSNSLTASSSMLELEKLLSRLDGQSAQESTRARYVKGFILRHTQYRTNTASGKDFCMNLRDIVMVFGRLRVSDKLYRIVRDYGKEFDLICESENYVSVIPRKPDWLTPDTYINEVYALKPNNEPDISTSSPGDASLYLNSHYTSYKSFEQKLAVHTALNLPAGKTLLISQPTGGGKSLVTQMVASMSGGLTLVIVPTVALALDQFHSAEANIAGQHGIYCYRGEQSAAERLKIIRSLESKTACLLFSSPEAIFKNTELHTLLEKAATEGYLKNIVIDEAHVVPDWGVFFRPDFQIFSITLRKWRILSSGQIRTYLLSATLSEDVVGTLFSLFGEEGHNVQLRCDCLRQEPRFYFQTTKSKREQDAKTLEAIRLLPKPMVVYVLEPREAKELQKQLTDFGFKNIPVFSGDTKDSDREAILKGWKDQEYDLVIATSAFGIGVDKPDVRTILHACVPENLSRFYQEVGRAGRDRLPSLSILLPYQSFRDGESDVDRARGLVNKRVLTEKKAVIRWESMLHHPRTFINNGAYVLDTSATPSSMSDEEAEYAGNRNIAWNINLLLLLYRTGFLDLTDVSFQASNHAYMISVKPLRPELLGSLEVLTAALEEPRQREYDAQMEGYYIMRNLVAHPRSKCWGRVFQNLFPLSRDVCNGCPVDGKGRITTDTFFKLRKVPELQLPPVPPGQKLHKHMGSYQMLAIRRTITGDLQQEEIVALCQKSALYGIGCLVIPPEYAGSTPFSGLVLTYDEFNFCMEKAPYVFHKGVLCILTEKNSDVFMLFRHMKDLEKRNTTAILYCAETLALQPDGKTYRECVDGYDISFEKY